MAQRLELHNCATLTAQVIDGRALGDQFDGYSVAAGWEDTKLGIGHVSKWKRIALVTNHDWIRHTVGMFGWMVPGDVKVFPLQDQSAAMEWAAG